LVSLAPSNSTGLTSLIGRRFSAADFAVVKPIWRAQINL